MNIHANKPTENQSKAIANECTQKENDSEAKIALTDNRAETIAQKKMQEFVNNSPKVTQMRAFQEIANNCYGVTQLKNIYNQINEDATLKSEKAVQLMVAEEKPQAPTKEQLVAWLNKNISAVLQKNPVMYEYRKDEETKGTFSRQWDSVNINNYVCDLVINYHPPYGDLASPTLGSIFILGQKRLEINAVTELEHQSKDLILKIMMPIHAASKSPTAGNSVPKEVKPLESGGAGSWAAARRSSTNLKSSETHSENQTATSATAAASSSSKMEGED